VVGLERTFDTLGRGECAYILGLFLPAGVLPGLAPLARPGNRTRRFNFAELAEIPP
jgi:hypothetical protein